MSRPIIFIYEGKEYIPKDFVENVIGKCSELNIVYYGSIPCQSTTKSGKYKGERCTNRAYYRENNKYLCGQHSNKTNRTTLPKNKMRAENRKKEIDRHHEEIEEIMADNFSKSVRGNVKCCRMYMMKKVPLVYGYLNVFPNNKHTNRKDGFGCGKLSPMQLGPVIHNQPGLPNAKNIENYHQFSKCWPNEIIKINGEIIPTKEWKERRLEGYNDSVLTDISLTRKKCKN